MTGVFAHFLAGGKVAHDHLTISLLREQAVSQIAAVMGEHLAADGAPRIEVLKGERALGRYRPSGEDQNESGYCAGRTAHLS